MENSGIPAHTLEQTLTLFMSEEYGECLASLEYYATREYPDACAQLGLAYQLGLGVGVDRSKAILFLTKAANLGSGLAAHNLGTLYTTIPPVDEEMARTWFHLAKKLGFKPGSQLTE